jgi:hypothetical protein
MEDSGRGRVNAAILEVVENQMRENDPPQTRSTYNRLIAQGYSDPEARKLIGCVVISELNDILKHEEPFNRRRFVKALRRLPTLPWE